MWASVGHATDHKPGHVPVFSRLFRVNMVLTAICATDWLEMATQRRLAAWLPSKVSSRASDQWERNW